MLLTEYPERDQLEASPTVGSDSPSGLGYRVRSRQWGEILAEPGRPRLRVDQDLRRPCTTRGS
jgi:hypothetical protein